LQVLNASHNAIQTIEGSFFTDFGFLQYLDLSSNNIIHLPNKTFETMSQLKSIKLNNNSLATIDDGVFSELKLNLLDLSCNQISNDNFLWPSLDIEYLNLTFNEYKEINSSVLENIETELWGEKGF
jgi:Leucine-rich repeat (LRR) protein